MNEYFGGVVISGGAAFFHLVSGDLWTGFWATCTALLLWSAGRRA